MEVEYKFKEIEKKWQNYWENKNSHKTDLSLSKPKYYCLDMFPYPSGSGLHVGHIRGYTLSDVWARYKKMQGYNVLHPMGWDAFGLPAENDAIKKGIHPSILTQSNINNFKKQLKAFSFMYDWDREISTCDPSYYKWTQWIFLKMFQKGLAYQKEMPVNWCPSCKTGLANEEVVNGLCERCGETVTKKKLKQWMLKITEYAERLLNDLDKLDWPDKVKQMQANWIGKSEGAEVIFKAKSNTGRYIDIPIFTTRPDTLYGATYMVLAPEHPLVFELTSEDKKEEVLNYIEQTSKKSDLERTTSKEKTGVFIGAYAINPVNNENIPIWVADYVLIDYGTGAIMAVPAHDQRDFEFAKKFNLPIKEVISPDGKEYKNLEKAFEEDGIMINSEQFNGLPSKEAKKLITEKLSNQGLGKFEVKYKLRDWIFSRQRYWGEPIPIVHCNNCGEVALDEHELPLILPQVQNYKPSGTGESPLATINEFVNTTCPKCKGTAKRETNTMPQWAGSCWYFLRYIDPNNDKQIFNKQDVDKWLPVDMYVGGIEHAVLHLLYARFFVKFLYDIGVISFDEPFKRLFTIGMVYRFGAKMSKSKGNVVSPDELLEKYGADTVRIYELFMGPPELDSEWDDNGIEGVYRFLKKVWKLINEKLDLNLEENQLMEKRRHQVIQKVTTRLEEFKFNTVVSALMEYVNFLSELEKIDKNSVYTLTLLLAPLAPHLSEEIWQSILKNENSVFEANWPTFDESKTIEEEVNIAIQINGKVRGTIKAPLDSSEENVFKLALTVDNVVKYIQDKEIKKKVYIKNKILSLVV